MSEVCPCKCETVCYCCTYCIVKLCPKRNTASNASNASISTSEYTIVYPPPKLFDNEIGIIASAMQHRLIEKQAKYGDLWKNCGIDQLRKAVDFIYDTMKERRSTEKEMISLVDLANQCMLLYLRLKGEKATINEEIEECPHCGFVMIKSLLQTKKSCHRCGIMFNDKRIDTMHSHDLSIELNKERELKNNEWLY